MASVGAVVALLLALVVALSSGRGAIAVALLLTAHWPSSVLLVRGLVLLGPMLLLPLLHELLRLPARGGLLEVWLLHRLLRWRLLRRRLLRRS